MAENTTPHSDANSGDAESVDSGAEQQEQEQQRIQTEERISMDPADMADAMDQEKDQKFDGDNSTRYEGDVDQALSNDD